MDRAFCSTECGSWVRTEKWEDRDGNKRQITKIIGSKLIMLGVGKKKEILDPGDESNVPF